MRHVENRVENHVENHPHSGVENRDKTQAVLSCNNTPHSPLVLLPLKGGQRTGWDQQNVQIDNTFGQSHTARIRHSTDHGGRALRSTLPPIPNA